jgi:hypothetical protein
MFGGMDYRPQALAVIEQNLADGDRHISRQLDLIAYARSMGWSTKEFEDLLAILQDNQNGLGPLGWCNRAEQAASERAPIAP